MDGAGLEHSDSDSGESWTLLDNTSSCAYEALELQETSPKPSDSTENADNEEETDGISIISDGDCPDLVYDRLILEEYRPTDEQIPEYISIKPTPSNNNDNCESIRGNADFLGDNAKLKTYVHRRNKRLSTVLNIIVLGSVITAAGVAIGHMWGVRHDCSINTTPSVNKILSNLYKLQEENAYLRNKLKELTLLNNIQLQQRKTDPEEPPRKLHKCRKVFEEPLNNKNTNKFTKCVDNVNSPDKYMMLDNAYEKELLSDLNKLKNVYQQNKSWLDEEITKRLKHEEKSLKKFKNLLKSPKFLRVNVHNKILKDDYSKIDLETPSVFPVHTETVLNVTEPVLPVLTSIPESNNNEAHSDSKVTYADSLKSNHKINKREIIENTDNKVKERIQKKKPPKEIDTISENFSESELKKDDRYNAHKFKIERKKNDRHKSYKKQKRRNKYEQWEMKGGYMKDYDDFSVTSSQENEFILKNTDKNHLSRDFERKNYIDQFSESEDNVKSEGVGGVIDRKGKLGNRTGKREKANVKKDKDVNWYEKRAALRQEARKKLELELFGDSTPNNAGWYFRRMQRREQCRVKGDNSTYKKNSKRMKNFKTKH